MRSETSAARQLYQPIQPASDQRFLFHPAPALQLPFGSNCIFDTLELLGVNQLDRTPRFRVSVKFAGVVLVYALLKVITSRADIVMPIATPQNVDEGMHADAYSVSLTASSFDKLRMR